MRAPEKFRKILSKSGATGPEYAVLLAGLAIAAIAGVTLAGDKVSELFGGASNHVAIGNSVPSDPTGPSNPPVPSISASVDKSAVHLNDAATFSWTSQNASGVSAAYTLSGTCTRLGTFGPSPQALGWSGQTGSQSVSWAPDLAGCGYSVKVTATGAGGARNSTAATSFALLDISPDGLLFGPVTGVDPSSTVTSDAASVTGIEAPAPLSVTGGLVSVDNGAFGVTGDAPLNSSIRLQAQAPATFGTTGLVSLQAGSSTSTWSVTTRERDTVPDAISFDPSSDKTAGNVAQSNAMTVGGFDGQIAIAASNALVSVDGSAFAPTGMASRGSSVVLEATAPAFGSTLVASLASQTAPDGSLTQNVTFGSWNVTAAQDRSPNNFTFNVIGKFNPGASAIAETAEPLTGFDGSLMASASNGALLSTDGTNFSSTVTVTPNQNLWVQLIASAVSDGSGSVSSIVSVGDTASSVVFQTKDLTPNAFNFNVTGKFNPGSTAIVETSSALAGFDGTVTASATNGALLSTDGANFSPSISVAANQNLWVQMVASSTSDGTGSVSSVVSVGGTSSSVTLATKDQTPQAIAFTPSTNNVTGNTATSNSVTISGIPDGAVTMKVASANASAQFKIDSNAWVSATASGMPASVSENDTLQLQLTTSGAPDSITVTFYDSLNQPTGTATWNVTSATKWVRSSGGLYTFTVPVGITSINVKMWGGAGGSFYYDGTLYGFGGAGGYSTGTIAVTPGDVFNVYVGSGGGAALGGRYGGGGGGATAMTKVGVDEIVAGGGAGAGMGAGASGGSIAADAGGLGGGSSGTKSTMTIAGGAGTQTAVGAGGVGLRRTGASGSGHNGGIGSGAASSNNGGNGWGYGNGGAGGTQGSDAGAGGGGGGRFGGGGGGGDTGASPGGGGSGYIGGPGVTGASTSVGSVNIPANTSDTDYIAAGGKSGRGGDNTGAISNKGIDGLVVITY